MGYQAEHKLGFYWQMTAWSQKELQKKAQKEDIHPHGHKASASDTGSKRDHKEKELIFPVLAQPMGELQVVDPDGEYSFEN